MVGNVPVGGDAPISIQSMTNTRTQDVAATVKQINELAAAGCEIIRCAVPDMEAARAISEIKKQINIPLVADIHFDYRLAIAAIENGADKIRINPGNIGALERIQAVVEKAIEYHVPIRIGVNSGSLEKHLVQKYGGVTAEGLVESALDKIHIVEQYGLKDIIVSIKSSDVMMCIRAYELMVQKTDYPLHVGITESGPLGGGIIKSSVGLTGERVEEINTAKKILAALGLRKAGIEVISCPTCGRTQIDLITLANQVEKLVAQYDLDLRIAVMGCVVNGPGEAREADLGVAGGCGEGLLFKKGKILRKMPEDQLLAALKDELDHWEEERI